MAPKTVFRQKSYDFRRFSSFPLSLSWDPVMENAVEIGSISLISSSISIMY